MAPPLDFNATLAEQLRDAGMQMRAMTKPQKPRATPNIPPDTPSVESSIGPNDVSPSALTRSAQDGSADGSSDAAAAAPASAAPTTAAAPVPVTAQATVAHAHADSQPDDQSSHADSLGATGDRSTAQYDSPATLGDCAPDSRKDTLSDRHQGMRSAQSAQRDTLPASAPHGHSAAAPGTSPAATATETPGTTQGKTAFATAGTAAMTTPKSTGGTTAPATGVETAGLALAAPVGTPAESAVRVAARMADDGTEDSTGDVTGGVTDGTTAGSAARCEDGHSNSQENSQENGRADSPAQGRADSRHAGSSTLAEHSAHIDGAPSLPDAASELWAMSHHSEAPTLSERSWTGGVRGAVLDALRGLAGGQGHVLVNLKRLATHTGISYGSVRNAMSRLTRSGDIHTRQIRMADGHGVRVEFLTLPGQEGTGIAAPTLVSSQAAILGQAGLLGQSSQTGQSVQSGAYTTVQQVPAALSGYATSPAGAQTAYYAAQSPVTMTVDSWGSIPPEKREFQQIHDTVPMTVEQRALAYAPTALTPVLQTMMPGQQPQQQLAQHLSPQSMQQLAPQAAPQSYAQDAHSALAPAAPLPSPSPAHTASFWDTQDSLFALAWPHVAVAGLRMAHLRALAPLFTVQGFDPAVLPRTLRYLDWELEQAGLPEDDDTLAALPPPLAETAHQLTQSFMRAMQRRGTWPRPAGYEEGDD